jgi:hypothetical protein
MIPLDSNLINDDISSYTKAKLRGSKEFQKRWGSSPETLTEIETAITKKSGRM